MYQHKVDETRLQELKGKLQREACTETIEGTVAEITVGKIRWKFGIDGSSKNDKN